MQEIKEPLIKIKTVDQTTYTIKKEILVNWFTDDNLRSNQSSIELIKFGGMAQLQKSLKTNYQTGIDTRNKDDFVERGDRFDRNTPIVTPSKSFFELITEQLSDTILQILIGAAVVSLIIDMCTEGIKTGWMEGSAILMAVLIILNVTATNNYMKDKQFQKLKSMVELRKVNVKRNGKIENISVYDLLVGDILLIETGDILPVDGIVVTGNNMMADESTQTGESDSINKSPLTEANPDNIKGNEKSSPFLISGSKIIEGTGEMLVACVGVNTRAGQSKLKMQEEDDPTPLQEKLEDLADIIGKFGMTSAFLTFAGMSIHLIAEKIYYKEPVMTLDNFSEILGYFIIGVTIIVVAVPEGLPLAVTLALAYSVGKMKDENNLVRFLQACETMGGANNVCSDKTGTLTMNQMTVTNLLIHNQVYKGFDKHIFDEKVSSKLCFSVIINSNAHPKIRGDTFEQIGNKTECALLEMAYKIGYDFTEIRKPEQILKIFPFSSKRKRMTSIYYDKVQAKQFLFCKGAADVILPGCSSYLKTNGEIAKITEEYTKYLNEQIQDFAKQSLRTLLLTYKDITLSPEEIQNPQLGDDKLCSEMIVIGLVGIKDPLRPEIPQAVKKCENAGVKVRMITGDVKHTAVAIAKDAGILDPSFDLSNNRYEVMDGKEFREFVGGLILGQTKDDKPKVGNITNFEIVASKLKVLARSSPEDKYLMVVGLKQLGDVVAVTGDGTNDAPALKKADIGFAMGIAGTEVAKEAAGIILLDDNFSSIVTAIKWGRNIFLCIRKFLQFQLTVNVSALFMVLLGGLVLRQSPLNSIQMLWVNLIMDTMGALALATEPPKDELLKTKPYSRRESFITSLMWRNIICQGTYQIIIMTIILFKGAKIFGIPSSIHNDVWTIENGEHFTMFFNIFVFMQVFNEINSRKLKREEINVFDGFCINPLFVFIIVGTIIVQLLIVEYGGYAMKVSPLSIHEHIICILIASTVIGVQILIKQIPDNLFSWLSKPTDEDNEGKEKEEADKNKDFKFKRSQSLRSQKSKIQDKGMTKEKQENIELQDIKLNK